MKKLLNILLAVSLIVALASCEKDEEPATDLTLNNNNVSINLNTPTPTATVSVESGNGGYEAKSSDETVVTASASGTTITVTAKGEGTATVTVTDSKGKTASFSVTVSYAIPTAATFKWNGLPVEFDKAGAYGISILANGVALTNLTSSKKQYYLTWTGGLSEGDKTGGKLIIAESGKEAETIDLTSLKVVQANQSGNYLIFSNGTLSGELLFSK